MKTIQLLNYEIDSLTVAITYRLTILSFAATEKQQKTKTENNRKETLFHSFTITNQSLVTNILSIGPLDRRHVPFRATVRSSLVHYCNVAAATIVATIVAIGGDCRDAIIRHDYSPISVANLWILLAIDL